MAKKLIFTGCSFTAGAGWSETSPKDDVKDSPYLWTNLCWKGIDRLKDLELINLGKSGASNTEIFRATVSSMSKYGSEIDTLFCQWTAMPRYNFQVGFELWDTTETFASRQCDHDINLNRGDKYTRQYVDDLLDRLKTLHHLHWEILQVVEFSHTLMNLAKHLSIENIYFINGLCPWDRNYFVKLTDVLPEDYTPFTKKEILNIESRDDRDIFALYDRAHRHYQDAGGIHLENWINLYDSFLDLRIDRNHDREHPGIKSNQKYFHYINQRLQKDHQAV